MSSLNCVESVRHNSKSHDNSLYRNPTSNELKEINKTKFLYDSNIIKLQLEELISTVQSDYNPNVCFFIETFLNDLNQRLMNAPSKYLSEENFHQEFPFLNFKPVDDHFKGIEFSAPKRIDLIGSYQIKTGVYPNLNCDVAIELPPLMFKNKDYMNYRYQKKRSAYIGSLYKYLKESYLEKPFVDNDFKITSNVCIAPFGDDIYRPIIVIYFTSNKNHLQSKTRNKTDKSSLKNENILLKWSIRILPLIPKNIFKEKFLLSDKNNLKTNFIYSVNSTQSKSEIDSIDSSSCTPLYNSSILEDMRLRTHFAWIYRCSEKYKYFKESVVLLKVWASHKNFFLRSYPGSCSNSAISGFIMTVLAAHVCISNDPLTSKLISFYQIFKLVLNFLRTAEFDKYVYIFGNSKGIPKCDLASTKKCNYFDYEFYDSEECAFNFFWRMQFMVEELQEHAKKSFTLLGSSQNIFDSIFLLKITSELTCDAQIKIKNIHNVSEDQSFLQRLTLPDEFSASNFENGDYNILTIINCLKKTFKQAFTNRLKSVNFRFMYDQKNMSCDGNYSSINMRPADSDVAFTYSCWNDVHSSRMVRQNFSLHIGLIFTNSADKVIDKGSPVETEDAKSFKKFWLNKTEIRKFNDGSILECILWKKPDLDDKISLFPDMSEQKDMHSVSHQILNFVLEKKYNIFNLSERIKVINNNETFLTQIQCTPIGSYLSLPNYYKSLHQTSNELKDRLHSLSGLPLAIKEIKPADSSFCYTDTEYLRHAVDNGKTRHDLILIFESSSKWPLDREALKNLKTAFLLNMKDELLNDYGIKSKISAEYLDVHYQNYVFRLKIFHPRDLKWIDNISDACCAESTKSSSGMEILNEIRDLWWRPQIMSHLNDYSAKYRSFSEAVRLIKLWAGENLLNGFDEFIEHVMMHVYSLEYLDIPNSSHVAFYRFFWFLNNHDWDKKPLIIELNTDDLLTETEKSELHSIFESCNSADFKVKHPDRVSPYFWISTLYDKKSMLITIPSKSMCKRFLVLSRTVLKLYKNSTCNPTNKTSYWLKMYEPDVESFDMIVNLTQCSGERMSILSKFRHKGLRSTNQIDYVNLNHAKKKQKFENELPYIFKDSEAKYELMNQKITDIFTSENDFLKFAFEIIMKGLNTYLSETFIFAYNPLVVPIPNKIFVKFNPKSFLLQPLSLSFTSYRCLLNFDQESFTKDFSESRSGEKLNFSKLEKGHNVKNIVKNQVLTVENMTFLFSSMMSLGKGIITDFEFVKKN